ncbi:MAG: putative tellurium resistance membrane protein TerC, partial [Cocleimonas sp.]
MRIVLLFSLLKILSLFTSELFDINIEGFTQGSFNLKNIVVFLGGIFLIYTALKEIFHMMMLEESQQKYRKPSSFASVLFSIVIMNAIFSFDSILSAMALTQNFILMATAILIGGVLMVVLADRVTEFLKKNRMYEIVGLFILFLVGAMLLS